MKGISALLLLCAASHFAAGSSFSTIHTLQGPGATHGLLGTNLLGIVAWVLSVTGSAYSHAVNPRPEAQSLSASNKAPELGEDLFFGTNFPPNIAGGEFDRGFQSNNGSTGFVSAQRNTRNPPWSEAGSYGGHFNKPKFTMYNETEYRCYGIGPKVRVLNFKVKTAYSALVALLGEQKLHGPAFEIRLGGWGNSKSAIKDRLQEKDHAVVVDTPKILSQKVFRGFWIKWEDSTIMVGKEERKRPFMTYEDSNLFQVRYLCFFPGAGFGSWIIEGVRNKWPSTVYAS